MAAPYDVPTRSGIRKVTHRGSVAPTARVETDRAGIRPGDSIESVDGKQVASAEDLVALLASLHPGQKVKIGILPTGGASATAMTRLGRLSAG